MTVFTWPNVISVARIPLAAAFVIAESDAARLGIVVAAALSDFIDGKLARGTGHRTRSGEFLDPVTDKLFMLTVLATLVWEGSLGVWALILILARDLYATAAFIVAGIFRLPIRFRSRMSGKVVTTLQLLTVLAVLAWPESVMAVVVVTGAAGLWAIVDYTRAGLLSLRRENVGT